VRPPLWHFTPKPASVGVRVLAGLGFLVGTCVTTLLLVILLEAEFLSDPIGTTEVTVSGVEAGRSAEKHPTSFRHLVVLADGSRNSFVCARIHRPGEKLMVTASRGRLTGRVWLSVPYRVLAAPEDPPWGR
jgi:hypothetical protein